jgi:hypothetical protein
VKKIAQIVAQSIFVNIKGMAMTLEKSGRNMGATFVSFK